MARLEESRKFIENYRTNYKSFLPDIELSNLDVEASFYNFLSALSMPCPNRLFEGEYNELFYNTISIKNIEKM
ncbi:hypothetical protein MSBRW_2522 [Methanosarcina barkeri str. Wiesmoor]|uniref:Uncharacterized protein n=1 Tax=Methanosarcina barkeri str. Wiesmoor TaxID=1434109 RepID=A0A0E3QN22_METBA|nr:hypothetical protein MSBRW_2522 [Methanosarcina barkeri str. Wiesmoor]